MTSESFGGNERGCSNWELTPECRIVQFSRNVSSFLVSQLREDLSKTVDILSSDLNPRGPQLVSCGFCRVRFRRGFRDLEIDELLERNRAA